MDLVARIKQLKSELNAVILAHNYQIGEVQDVADFVGDSLGLSMQASQTQADVIVFCGVRFMAETAAILCPDKTVLLPEISAGCPLADMITAEQLREIKDKSPDILVVSYVNTTADVKALSDYCCTSSNAIALVSSLPPDREILFVPDRNLGAYVMEKTGRRLRLWPGYCPTHIWIDLHSVEKTKREHPDALVLAHPECTADVRAIADKIFSTGQMINFIPKTDCREFIIATESGIIDTLYSKYPGREFYPVSERALCPNMKKIDLEKIIWSMEGMKYRIVVPDDIRINAKRAIETMLEVAPG